MRLKNIKLWLLFFMAVLAMPFATLTSCSTDPVTIAHPFRGTNVAGGEMDWGLPGTPRKANTDNPTSGSDFLFVTNQDIDYLASKKVGFLRMVISWEGLQPVLNQPFSTGVYNQALQARVAYATGKGMNVLVEPHGGSDANFIRWKGGLVGSTAVPNSAFADFWSRMAVQFKSNPRVLYGLGNEPHDMSTAQWFASAQAAITAIRATGSTQMIFVPGNAWSGPSNWTNASVDKGSPQISNANAFLKLNDSAKNLVASVHLYLDQNGGGGADDIASPTIGIDRMSGVVAWAKTNGIKVHISEIGANLAASTAPQAQVALKNLFDYIQANSSTVIGWSWWAYGNPVWWDTNRLTLSPTRTTTGQLQYTTDNPRMAWLAPHFAQPALDGVDASPPPATSPTKPANPIAFTADTVFTTSSFSPAITNWAYVPRTYDNTHNTPMKLFVWLHGCGGQSQWDAHMVSFMPNQNWISLAPGGREGACWSGVATDGPKVLAAIADLKTHFNIDPRRVILGGYSSGGDIGYPLLFQNANMFAGGMFENTGPNSAAMTASTTAGWKLNIAHLHHTGDTTYPIATIRTNMNTLQTRGFPVTLIEKPGTHYDNDNGTTGTQYDLRTFLLPYLNSGWVSPGVVVVPPPPPPPASCIYTYSPWGECQPTGTQARSVTGSTPSPCTASPQVLSQVCVYVPPVVDSGTDSGTDAGTLSPFYARRYVYNQGATWTCMYFYVKNTTEANRNWSLMYVNAYDSKLTSYWSMNTNQVIGSTGSVKFTPKDVTSIPAKGESKVGGACFDLGPLKKIPTVSGIN